MLVKVWNDNVHPYTEKFKGDTIKIPPKSWIEMELYDAHQFLGQMPPEIKTDSGGTQLPEYYKMLRIEQLGKAPEPPKKFICMQDGREFQSQAGLDEYIRENYLDQIVDDESREEFTKRGRGRPKKVTDDTGRNRDSGEA